LVFQALFFLLLRTQKEDIRLVKQFRVTRLSLPNWSYLKTLYSMHPLFLTQKKGVRLVEHPLQREKRQGFSKGSD